MKTRVLMFGWEFPPHNSGGLGVACLGLTKAMSHLGMQVLFVMPKKLDVSSDDVEIIFADRGGVMVHEVDSILSPYLNMKSYTYTRGPNNIDDIYGKDLLSEVRRYAIRGGLIAMEETFDIIYAHDWLSFGAGLEAKRLTGKPLVVHVHATEFDRCGGMSNVNREVFEAEKRGMELADRVVAVSELTKNIIVREYGIPEWKVSVVYNGIDESTAPRGGNYLPRLRALKSTGYKIVLFLGRITLQKGPDYFIKTAKKVLERNNRVIFVVSGSGDMERSVMELAASLGIANNILFTGFLQGNERHEAYISADLFVMPSVSEPFGITPLEAMRLGTPTLISKQSGVAEIVTHTLKADFWDVDDMTNKILAVVGYPGLAAALKENGIRQAEDITWTQAAKKVDSILTDVLASV